MAVEMDVLRRIYATNESAYLELGDWPEAPANTLELRATDKESIEFFGNVNLVMTPEFALVLGNALIIAANEKGIK